MEAVSEGAIWHSGQSATLRLGPKAVLAEFGALHPALTRHFDVDGPAMAVQIFLDAIPAKRASGPARAAFAPPALQSVRRDFAFLAPEGLAAADLVRAIRGADRSEEHTSELQSLMRISYAVFCLKKKTTRYVNKNEHY